MSNLAKLLTAQETADLLSISIRKVRSLTASGDLPCIRIGTRVLIHPLDLEKWIARKRRKPPTGTLAAQALSQDDEAEPEPQPTRRRKRG
jgi:excisionase family DNA binding protein